MRGTSPMRRACVACVACVVVGAATTSGCFDPYSNTLFEEDALFLAAIPDAERVTTRAPSTRSDRQDWATFPIWTLQTSTDLNTMIFTLLYVVEYVASQPIAERLDDERIWGPLATGDGLAVELRMTRVEGDGGVDRFDYAMSWFDEGGDPATGVVPFRGSFEAGTVPREGVGEFVFDFGLYHQVAPAEGDLTAGELVVEHDNSEGRVLLWIDVVAVEGAGLEEPESARYAYFYDPADGSGWFEYVWVGDAEGSATEAEERWEARVRWTGDGAGRADARLSGGDLEPWDLTIEVTECWDSGFQQVYLAGDEEGPIEPVGDPGACVYDDQELPSHL